MEEGFFPACALVGAQTLHIQPRSSGPRMVLPTMGQPCLHEVAVKAPLTHPSDADNSSTETPSSYQPRLGIAKKERAWLTKLHRGTKTWSGDTLSERSGQARSVRARYVLSWKNQRSPQFTHRIPCPITSCSPHPETCTLHQARRMNQRYRDVPVLKKRKLTSERNG